MTPEQRVLGATIRGVWAERVRYDPLPIAAFEEPFHAAAYQAALLLVTLGKPVTSDGVWALTSTSTFAEPFGPKYLASLADAGYDHDADAWEDVATLMERAAHQCFTSAAELMPTDVPH
jgi:hypothetical protein